MPLEMKYFVLKPKAKHRYDVFARASQNAMIAYANSIKDSDLELAEQLTKWALKENKDQDKAPQP